jgi:hypothetical protein
MGAMANILREAMEEISNLPEADQEKIGRELLSHLEKLRRLRGLDIEGFLRDLNARHGGA